MTDPLNPSDQTDGLPSEVEKRKIWFYECQLRWLNLAMFRDITEQDAINTAKDQFPDRRINLITEPIFEWSFQGRPIGGQLKNHLVYLDDQEPI